jgi:16S rRNA (cytosine967-C5)-methyltransferase
MSLAGNQQKILLRLLATLRPCWHRDRNLPARIQALFAANRSYGSRDRRLYRELIYTSLRFLPWVEPLLDRDPGRAAQVVAWLATDLPATRAFRAELCGDWPSSPPTIAAKASLLAADAGALLPDWVGRHCPAAAVSPNLDCLHTRSPLWLRINHTGADRVCREFDDLGWNWQRSELLPTAVRLPPEVDVTKTLGWREGLIEVQDLGSQMILASIGVEPGQRWLDACAGAGGKTLQLAGLLGPDGHVDAYDVRPAARGELKIRATRAGLFQPAAENSPSPNNPPSEADRATAEKTSERITILTSAPTGQYDGVLVDAPCSGSGTWRRSPHLKWTTSAGGIAAAARKQLSLLEQFAVLVRPGGRLVYATCSLSGFENEAVVAAFLRTNSAFAPASFAQEFGFESSAEGLTILPARHDTDGFFVSSLRRS